MSSHIARAALVVAAAALAACGPSQVAKDEAGPAGPVVVPLEQQDVTLPDNYVTEPSLVFEAEPTPEPAPSPSETSEEEEEFEFADEGTTEIEIPGDVLFATGDDRLSDDGRRAVARFAAQLLEKAPDALVVVIGHTDSRGTPESNQTLSESRAANVKAALEAEGLASDTVTSCGRGERELKESDHDDQGNFLPDAGEVNRRVQFLVTRPGGVSEVDPDIAGCGGDGP